MGTAVGVCGSMERIPVFQLQPQGGEGDCQIFALDQHIVRDFQVDRGEVPDGLNAAGNQTVADLLRLLLGHGDDADADIVIAAEGFQPVHGIDGLAAFGVVHGGVDIETRKNIQPGFFETAVIQQRLPQLAGTHQNAAGGGGEVQVFFNILDQTLPGTTGPAFALVGDPGKVLTDLNMPQSHGVGNGGGGNGDRLLRQRPQMIQVNRQPLQQPSGNESRFHVIPPHGCCIPGNRKSSSHQN